MNPETVLLTAIAVSFGLATGSFLNVCIYRIPLGLAPWRPARSFCPACEALIAWYDNLPLLSFPLLRGHCRRCGCRIPYRYPLVELTMGVAFGLMAARYGASLEALKWCVAASMLVALFWTDLEHRLLPDELTLGGALAGLAFAAFLPPVSLIGDFFPEAGRAFQSLAAAAGSALLLAVPLSFAGWLYKKIRGPVGLGRGDVKLLLLIGAFFGAERGVWILLIASIAGAIIGLAYIRLRRLDPKTYGLPFGSFIAASGFLALLGGF